jgi:hypothetical protein
MNLFREYGLGEPEPDSLAGRVARRAHGRVRTKTVTATLAFAATLFSHFMLPPPAARAQTADVARLTCGQLLDARGGESERLLLWLHGYYAGAAQRPILDGRQADEAIAAMRKTCEGDRALPLIGPQARAIFLSAAPLAEVKPSASAPSPPAPAGGASGSTRPAPVR